MKQITIIGLGYIGTSIALSLRTKYGNQIKIIGFDSNQDVQRKTKKLGAIDDSSWNLPDSVNNSELIVIATPPNSIEEILVSISNNLSENSVVTDTAVTKEKILEWAEKHIPGKFVGGNPLVGGLEGNNSDPSGYIFTSSKWALITPVKTPEKKISSVVNFVENLGAKPFFLGALEHDSYTVATSVLPYVFSSTIMNALSESPSWHEMSQFAGKQFNQITSPSKDLPDISFGAIETTNKILIEWVNRTVNILEEIKTGLKDENISNNLVLEKINQAWKERIRVDAGLANRRKSTEDRPRIPTASEGMMSLFFGNKFANVLSGSDKKREKNNKSVK